jgi:hypothetical protein
MQLDDRRRKSESFSSVQLRRIHLKKRGDLMPLKLDRVSKPYGMAS